MARKFVPKWWQTLSDPCSTFYLAFFMILFDLFDMTLYLYAMFVIELWKRKLKLLNKKFKKSRLESLNPGNFRALECQYSGMSLSLPLSWHAQLLKLLFSNILLSRCPIRETASPLSHLNDSSLSSEIELFKSFFYSSSPFFRFCQNQKKIVSNVKFVKNFSRQWRRRRVVTAPFKIFSSDFFIPSHISLREW